MAIYDIDGNNIDEKGGSSGSAIDYDKIVKTIAHRGASQYYPENTIPSFKGAKELGFNYVETDVRWTSDGVALCLHDPSINRTARNSDGTELSSTINLADITYEQALTYDFGIFKGSSWAGTKIPTLNEYLALCRNLMIHPYIELKEGTEAQIQSVVDAVNAYGLRGKVSYISFNLTLLGYVKDYDPYARLGFLDMANHPGTNVLTVKTDYNEVFYDTSHPNSNDNINRCKTARVPMEIWTVVTPSAVLAMDSYITGVTTNGQIIAGKVLYEANID